MTRIDRLALTDVCGGDGANTSWQGEHLRFGGNDLVESPRSPGKFVDVKGVRAGTEVSDPYTGATFRVPRRR